MSAILVPTSKLMRVYLDNCVFNRPFDDQDQTRIRLESEAVLNIRERIKSGDLELVWSLLIAYEANRNPFEDIRLSVLEWEKMASMHIDPSISIFRTANNLRYLGLKAVDSLHVAAAVAAESNYFISTDDGILSKLKEFGNLLVCAPISFVSSME